MALSIRQIVAVGIPAGLQAAGSRYLMSDIRDAPDHSGSYFILYDPETGAQIPCSWTAEDEARNPTERSRIELVHQLLVNGIDSLTDFIEHNMLNRAPHTEEPVERTEE